MEYQVSARKYRPMSFASVVGQEALTTTLKKRCQVRKTCTRISFLRSTWCGKNNMCTHFRQNNQL